MWDELGISGGTAVKTQIKRQTKTTVTNKKGTFVIVHEGSLFTIHTSKCFIIICATCALVAVPDGTSRPFIPFTAPAPTAHFMASTA